MKPTFNEEELEETVKKRETSKKDAKMLLNYRRLKDIQRCNNFHKIVSEDVAQHSWYVSILAMNIVDEYNSYHTEHNTEGYTKLDTLEVLRKALLHDTDECFTSDIPYNIKHSDPDTHEVIEKALNKHMDEVYEGVSEIVLSYKQSAQQCKDDKSGYIVGIADMLELAIYCYEEVTMGNLWMMSLLTKANDLTIQMMKQAPKVLGHKSVFFSACPTLVQLTKIISSAETSNSPISDILDIN